MKMIPSLNVLPSSLKVLNLIPYECSKVLLNRTDTGALCRFQSREQAIQRPEKRTMHISQTFLQLMASQIGCIGVKEAKKDE